MTAQTTQISVNAFVRLSGDHDRAGECGHVIAIRTDGTARFSFHYDQTEIDVPATDLSADTLVFWGI